MACVTGGIDPAVLAASVRVDRLVEADVGAVVFGDDLAGLLDLQLGLQVGRIVVFAVPAVVEAVPVKASNLPLSLDLAPRPLGPLGGKHAWVNI